MSKHTLTPILSALLATSAFLAVPAHAQSSESGVSSSSSTASSLRSLDFNQIDANRDGYVDSKEASAVPDLTGIMRSGDKDRDGKLSQTEFRSAVSAGTTADMPANPGRTAPGVGTGAATGGDK